MDWETQCKIHEPHFKKINNLLSSEIGGEWEIIEFQGRLQGFISDEDKFNRNSCNIIPNPKISEFGREVAQMIGFGWSSKQNVIAYNHQYLLISMNERVSSIERQIAKLLKMQVVDPPVYFRTYIEENCDCVWNVKELKLERKKKP